MSLNVIDRFNRAGNTQSMISRIAGVLPINAAQMIDELRFEDGQQETDTNVINIPFPMPEENLAQSLVIMDEELTNNEHVLHEDPIHFGDNGAPQIPLSNVLVSAAGSMQNICSRINNNLQMRTMDLIRSRLSFSSNEGIRSTNLTIERRSISMGLALNNIARAQDDKENAIAIPNNAIVDIEGPKDEEKWLFEKDFNNAQEFDDFLRNENTWVKGKKSSLTSGVKQYYRCNYVTQRAKKQCNASLYTISDFEPNNPKVRLFRKKSDHNHHELEKTSKKLNAEKVGEIRKRIGQM